MSTNRTAKEPAVTPIMIPSGEEELASSSLRLIPRIASEGAWLRQKMFN